MSVHERGHFNTLLWIGEVQSAKCKVQSAKCKGRRAKGERVISLPFAERLFASLNRLTRFSKQFRFNLRICFTYLSIQRGISLCEGPGLSSSFDSLSHIVRVANWETADEKKVPNSAGEVQSAKGESLESGVWRKNELAERL